MSKLVFLMTVFGLLGFFPHSSLQFLFFSENLIYCLVFFKAGSSAPLYIEPTEEGEANLMDSTELYEDSQLLSRSKAIAAKTKEIEQVSLLGILSLIR